MPKSKSEIGKGLGQVKYCPRCNQEKHAVFFYKCKGKADGLQSHCIECKREAKGIPKRESERSKAREERKKVEAIAKEFKSFWSGIRSAWTKSDRYKDFAKEVKREQTRKWALDNPEKVRERQRRYIRRNPEKVKAKACAYQEKQKKINALGEVAAQKKCGTCQEIKTGDEFARNRAKAGGLASCCKKCALESERKRFDKWEEERALGMHLVSRKECTKCSTFKEAKDFKPYRRSKDGLYPWCIPCLKENRRKKDFRRKDKIRAYYNANREKILKMGRDWQKANRKEITKKHTEYVKKRKKVDPVFDLKIRMRARLCLALKAKGFKKTGKTAESLGCDWDFLKLHIEKQFQPGMTWENRDLWHVDHIVPLASAVTKEEVLRLCHFSNLQPLWAEDNARKSASIVECQPELAMSFNGD